MKTKEDKTCAKVNDDFKNLRHIKIGDQFSLYGLLMKLDSTPKTNGQYYFICKGVDTTCTLTYSQSDFALYGMKAIPNIKNTSAKYSAQRVTNSMCRKIKRTKEKFPVDRTKSKPDYSSRQTLADMNPEFVKEQNRLRTRKKVLAEFSNPKDIRISNSFSIKEGLAYHDSMADFHESRKFGNNS